MFFKSFVVIKSLPYIKSRLQFYQKLISINFDQQYIYTSNHYTWFIDPEFQLRISKSVATLIIPKWKLADNDKSQIAEEETDDLGPVNLSGKHQGPMLKRDLDQNRASDRHHPTISLVHVQTDRSFRHVSSTLLFLTFQRDIIEFFSSLHSSLSLSLSLSNVNLHTRHTFFITCYVTQGWSRKKRESSGVCEIVNCSSDFRM